MSKSLATLQSVLKKYGYVIAAFLIPLAFRSVPEILSWPYPLGNDTVNIIPYIQSGWVFTLGPVGFLHTTGLFYILAALPTAITHDASVTIKILGPILLSGLSGMMYLYARRGLSWSSRKSLLVAVLVATYFVTLRISWDLYRQTLGLIFAVAALVALKSLSSPRKYYVAGAFMALTVLSHELAAVVLFFVVGLEAFSYFVKKSKRDFAFLMATIALPGALFWFQRVSLQQVAIVIPIVSIASAPSPDLALHIAGLLVYCYALILPLVLLGFRGLNDGFLEYWTVLCLGIPVLAMAFPSFSLYYWNRWVYLLVYPLLFYAAHGLARLWRFWSSVKGKIRRFVPKVFAVAYLFLLLTLSGYYLASAPESPFPFFSQYNPYLEYVPSSMLQNMVAVNDNPSLVACFEWLNSNANASSMVVEHYALYYLAGIYLHDVRVVSVRDGELMWAGIQNASALGSALVGAANRALGDGSSVVYTVWWSKGEGWYQIPSLPAEFEVVYSAGRIAVYSFNPEE